MRAEIISVGTELLLGDIVNTNAQYLAQQLAALGYTVYHQTVVGDNPQRLRQVALQGKERSDILVFTGGLGPTRDDLTKETVAECFGDTLVLDTDELVRLEYFFKKRGMPMTDNNRKQALVPKLGQKLPNPNGTAPGAWFRQGAKYAVLLPGPPGEMRPMFEEYVQPLLEAMQDGAIRSVVLRVFGIGESVLEEMLSPLLDGVNPTVALYAKTGEVHIRVTARGPNAEQADIMCDEVVELVRGAVGDAIYSSDGGGLDATVVRLLLQQGATIATAESCTGGLLSERITAVPGASAVFGYGAVTYANEAKHDMLGVRGGTLRRFGAVSSQVAAEMALGAAKKGRADYGVGITGIAGPDGGTTQKPVGLVYVAAAHGGQVHVRRLSINDRGREYVREVATHHALDMVRRLALGLPVPDAKAFARGHQADFDRESAPRRRGAPVWRALAALVLAALVLALVLVLASRGQGRGEAPSLAAPSAQGLAYGTAEYTTAACLLVAQAAAENPSVEGFVALPGALAEGLVAQVANRGQSDLDAAAGDPGARGLGVMAGAATPGAAGSNVVVLGGPDFDALLDLGAGAAAAQPATFTYYTARDARVYEVYAVFLFDAGQAADGFDPAAEGFAGYSAYLNHMLGAKARSLYDIPADTAPEDSYMALAVADPHTEGRRLYLCGRLLRPGQSMPEASRAVPAGEPLMPDAWYAEQGQAPADIDDVYLYWTQRLLTQETTNSALQLAAGMPGADTAPVVWRQGRAAPAASQSQAPASASSPPAGSAGEEGAPEAGDDSTAAEQGVDDSQAAESAAGSEAEAAESAPEPAAPAYQPPMVAERPDPTRLTVTMNGEEITDSTATVLAWICQRDAAGLPDEAVKALAVAAHSWILNRQGAGDSAPAVVGSKPSQAVLNAVKAVAGSILSADGKAPAFTPWFEAAADGTNTSQAVFGPYRGYLAGASSPYEQSRSAWRRLVTLEPDAVAALAAGSLGLDLTAHGSPDTWFADIARNEGGYVETLSLAGQVITGTQLWSRVLLAESGAPLLPSPAFEVEYKGSGFTFIVYGEGHGCGLSLSGAAGYAARDGWSWQQILEHYFPGAAVMAWD